MTGPKRIDGAESLSRVSGLPKAEVNAIWEQVKANSKTLESCPLHDFEGIKETAIGQCKDGGYVLREYRCSRCGGEARSTDVHWYQRGLEHGRRST